MIQHNVFMNSSVSSIYMNDITNCQIYYNQFTNINTQYIIYNKGGVSGHHIQVKFNHFDSNSVDNVIYDEINGISAYSGLYTIEYNNFTSNGAINDIISINSASGVDIEYNIFDGNNISNIENTTIIYKECGGDISILHNIFRDNQISGIRDCSLYKFYCNASDYYYKDQNIQYNTFTNNRLASSQSNSLLNIMFSKTEYNVFIEHNTFRDNIDSSDNHECNIIYMSAEENTDIYVTPFIRIQSNDFNETENIHSYFYWDMDDDGQPGLVIKKNNFYQYINIKAYITFNRRGITDDATLNYYGTTDERIIQSKMGDVCHPNNAINDGLIVWWPYYNITVGLGGQSKSASIFECLGIDNYPNITDGTKMYRWYLDPSINTLTVSNSPYYVINHVNVGTDLFIENGVEIIFLGDYQIVIGYNYYLGGSLQTLGISTVSNRNIGLANTTLYTKIHGDFNKTRIGKIFGNYYGDDISFYNTKIENLDTAIYYMSDSGRYTLDNCEISNVDYVIRGSSGSKWSSITDTYFYDVRYGIYGDQVSINHIKAESFTHFGGSYGNIFNVRDSEINGTGSTTCIRLGDGAKNNPIQNNNITGCYNGIYIDDRDNEGIQIRYNQISNCQNYGIIQNMNNGGIIIKHNTFIDNQNDIGSNNNDGDDYKILNNTFINTKQHSIGIYYNDNVDIIGNKFIINNDYTGYGEAFILIYRGNPQNLIIRYNDFFYHSGEYTIFFDRVYGSNYYIEYNRFISNIDNFGIIAFDGDGLTVNNIYISNNEFITNVVSTTPNSYIIYLESSSNTHISNNYFWMNYILSDYGSSLFKQTDGSNANFLRNNVTNNKLWSSINTGDTNNLLHFEQVNNINIEYNEFNDNIWFRNNSNESITNNIIYSSLGNMINITYNIFNQNEDIIYSYIYCLNDDSVKIQYNNFDEYNHSVYFIVWQSQSNAFNLDNGNFNYFAGLNDKNAISLRVYDFCESSNVGYITYYPWYQTPINIENDTAILPSDVNGANITDQYCKTDSPTTSKPTFVPTNYPTKYPTQTPTTSLPTISPTTAQPTTAQPTTAKPTTAKQTTTEPTLSPTQIPSNLPTQTPTTIPTKHPTAIPTSHPVTIQPSTSTPTTSKVTSSEEPRTEQPNTIIPTKHVLVTQNVSSGSTQPTLDTVDGVSTMQHYVSAMCILLILFVL